METTRLLAQITDADEEVRGEAIHELTLRMDDEVARALLDVASSDASEEIRADAIIGLGPVIDEAGGDYDDEEDDILYADDPDLAPPVSRNMFETIVREVRGLYDDEAQPKLVRRRALEVLVRDSQPWQPAEIRRHFASDDPDWKRTAVFAMGWVNGFANEIAALVVQSGDERMLIEAIQAAGRMEVTAAGARIRELAASKSTEPDLRLFAIEALPHVDRDSFDVLERLSQSDDEGVAAAAEGALEDLAVFSPFDDDDDDDDFEDDVDLGFEGEDDEDEDDRR